MPTPGPSIEEKPKEIDMSVDRWESLSAHSRYVLKQRLKIAKIKVSSGCQQCGYDKNHAALEHHHTGDKSENISQMVDSYGWRSIKKEMEKCVVLCANCHREIGGDDSLIQL